MCETTIWDFWAKHYEQLWVQKHSLKPTRELVINELANIINGAGYQEINLLDVGCGTGQLLQDIREKYPNWNINLTGVDKSAQMITKAVEKKLINAEFIRGDAVKLPFKKEKFEIITCCHSFPYYQDKQKALKELLRVLKPGGYLLLVQASENSKYDKLILKVVKITTSKASYPSVDQLREMVSKTKGKIHKQKRLNSKFFLPSIILSIIQSGD